MASGHGHRARKQTLPAAEWAGMVQVYWHMNEVEAGLWRRKRGHGPQAMA